GDRGQDGHADSQPATAAPPRTLKARHRLRGRLHQLLLAPLERPDGGRLQRWKLGAKARGDQLVNPVGFIEILEPVFSEVAQGYVRQRVVPEELPRRLRDQHVAAVPGGGNASGAVDAEADVALAADGRLA